MFLHRKILLYLQSLWTHTRAFLILFHHVCFYKKEIHVVEDYVLQFCKHSLYFLLGMVDPGEHISETLKREFMEEALNSGVMGTRDLETVGNRLKDFFDTGKEVYKGYVDDPRNTDNAWMETVAYLFHDDTGHKIGQFTLKAGDDAKALQWMDIDENLNLYASHKMFLMLAAKRLNAHWRKIKSQ